LGKFDVKRDLENLDLAIFGAWKPGNLSKNTVGPLAGMMLYNLWNVELYELCTRTQRMLYEFVAVPGATAALMSANVVSRPIPPAGCIHLHFNIFQL